MKNSNLRIIIAYPILFFFASCYHTPKLKKIETSIIAMDEKENKDENKEIAEVIMPYKTKMEVEMNEVLIESESPLTKDQPESSLGNMVADVTMLKANEFYYKKYGVNVDAVILNNGGLRSSLPKGKVTKRNVFELMPFENEIVIVGLSGSKTQELFNHIAKSHGIPVSGIKMGIKDTIPTDIYINGKLFSPVNNYVIATSDYLASGGDKMKFFKDPLRIDTVHYKIRNAIIDFMKEENSKGRKLNYKKDGRIYYAQ